VAILILRDWSWLTCFIRFPVEIKGVKCFSFLFSFLKLNIYIYIYINKEHMLLFIYFKINDVSKIKRTINHLINYNPTSIHITISNSNLSFEIKNKREST
jgi:hypothetical protein